MNHVATAWALTYLVHSTILILGVVVVSRWIRSAHVRDLLWKVALVGGVVTASLQLTVPSRLGTHFRQPVALVSDRTAPATFAADAEATTARTAERGEPATAASPRPIATPPAERRAADVLRGVRPAIERFFPFLWMGGAIALVFRLLLAHAFLLRDLKSRTEIVGGEDFDLLQRLTGGSRRTTITLSRSDVTQSPIAMVGPEIVVPSPVFARLTAAQRSSVLAHELAHVRRRDPAWLAFAEIVSAVFFFQPLNRLARRELKETAEYICDDAAVQQTGDPRALAETLAVLAARIALRPPLRVPAMAEGGSSLIRRVSRVLREDAVPQKPLKLVWRLLIAAVPLSLIAAVAPAVVPAEKVGAETSALHRAKPTRAGVTSTASTPTAVSAGTDVSVIAAADLLTRDDELEPDPASETVYVTGRKVETTRLKFNRFSDGVLNQSFEGPEGQTNVDMTAHAAEIALDGSSVRFFERDGFLRVRQEASAGPAREVEVTAVHGGESRYVYRVDGEETAWCRDAERVIAAGFRGRKAWDGWTPPAEANAPPGATPHFPNWNTHLKWTATHENDTGKGEGRRHLRLIARGVHYNPDTGEVFIEPGGKLQIDETVGGHTRSFRRTSAAVVLRGHGDVEFPREWIRRILRENSSLTEKVIDTLSRPLK